MKKKIVKINPNVEIFGIENIYFKFSMIDELYVKNIYLYIHILNLFPIYLIEKKDILKIIKITRK